MPATQANYIVADTLADAPTTSYKTNDMLYCKDTGRIYIHSGAAWTEQMAVDPIVAPAIHGHTHAVTTGQTATDHHPAPVAGPDSDITMDVAGAAGTASAFARSAHGHQLVTGGSAGTRTTPAAAGIQGAAGAVARAAHTHQSPGVIARRITSVAIANTETQVVGYNSGLPSPVINQAGFLLRFSAAGNLTTGTTPGSGIFRLRIGPTSLAGVIPATITLAQTASVTAAPFRINAEMIVRTIGATGSLIGSIWVDAQGGAAPVAFTAAQAPIIAVPTATVSADLTLATNNPELTYISGNAGSTATFQMGAVEVISIG